MYTEFYGFKEKPFNISPSPRYLYLGEIHKEALALLTYGVIERKGFILLTGEVGTGKTTMIRALIENLDASVHWEYLSNPVLSPMNFMNYLARSTLDRKTSFRSKTDFLFDFEAFLRKCLQQQKNFVLIIDEAQKLSFELLEEIRLLSNMETSENKLINIFLVGQPEINEKLNDTRCKAIRQRICNRYHIRPFDLKDTEEYITTRLKIAGADNPYRIMPKDVIKEIHRYSEGYPRAINVLSDNLLLLGYSRWKTRLTPLLVKEIYNDSRVDMALPQESEPGLKGVKRAQGTLKRSFGLHWDWAVLQEHPAVIGTCVVGIPDEKVEVKSTLPILTGKDTPYEAVRGPTSAEGQKEEKKLKVLTVKKGDTLTRLAARVYREANEHVLDIVERVNQGIEDVDSLRIHQKIDFPPLSRSGAHRGTYTVHISSFKNFKNARKMFQVLADQGYEVYIIPAYSKNKGKFFRVALGSFTHYSEAEKYVKEILSASVSDSAKTIRLETTGFSNPI